MGKDLEQYKSFIEKSKFKVLPLYKDEIGNIFFETQIIEDINGNKIAEGETFINIGYGFKNSVSRVLSNLFPMEINFRGKVAKSIEGILQGIKYQDIETQNLVLNYAGVDAYHIRACNELDFWGKDGLLYWQGIPIKRDSIEYQNFLDELYFCAIQNPLYKRALLSTGNKYLLHHIGREKINETVLTRSEYETRLNILKDFLITNEKSKIMKERSK